MLAYVVRTTHRVHRLLGTVLSLWLVIWFASGAVMTFSPFPRFYERERIATAAPLPALSDLQLPPARTGARLAMLEGRPTWFTKEGAWNVAPFEEARARREISARFSAPIAIARLEQTDQWTVPVGITPLYRARLADGQDTYLAARSGEIVQQTTREERLWSWFSAIPHWVYFTSLRRERALWRYSVLTLSTLGMVVTLSGMVAGVSVARRLRRTIRDRSLRWHQRLGLAFGFFAFTWLFSGALSLAPFQWTGERGTTASEQAWLFAARSFGADDVVRALTTCQRELEVRELEIASLLGRSYAVCLGAHRSRIVDLATQTIASRIPVPTGWTFEREPDAYYYLAHHAPLPRPYLRFINQAGITFYVDPARASLLARTTPRTRLERWLYNGLHSWDFPVLYGRPTLWRGVIWSAMALGMVLSGLGLWMAVRRKLRRYR